MVGGGEGVWYETGPGVSQLWEGCVCVCCVLFAGCCSKNDTVEFEVWCDFAELN